MRAACLGVVVTALLAGILPALLLMEKAKSADDSPSPRRQAKAAASSLQQLGDYQILREVGRGGMGVVYEAQQLSLGRHVAIKVLPSHAVHHPGQLGRFQREPRSAAKSNAAFGVRASAAGGIGR